MTFRTFFPLETPVCGSTVPHTVYATRRMKRTVCAINISYVALVRQVCKVLSFARKMQQVKPRQGYFINVITHILKQELSRQTGCLQVRSCSKKCTATSNCKGPQHLKKQPELFVNSKKT